MENLDSSSTKTDQAEEIQLSKSVMRLEAKLLGLVLGLVFGLTIFLMTNILILAGGHVTDSGERVIGPNLALLGQFFIGYRVTFVGSLIGFAYGFAIGTITGAIISRLYNWLVILRKRLKIGGKSV